MKMKNFFITCTGLALGIPLLAACAPKAESEFIIPEESKTNPFQAQDKDTGIREIMGAISHGISWEKLDTEEAGMLSYQGGELEIPYFVNASGIAVSSGFLLFVDGIPQPYKVKELGDAYEYMHVLSFEENTDTGYTLQFTPVTGKQGETLSLSIVSITDPQFQPDMLDTVSYGHSHKALEGLYTISFAADAEADSLLSERKSSVGTKRADGLTITEAETKQEELERFREHVEELDLDKEVLTELQIDGESMQLGESFSIKGKEKLHMTYEILGHPGLEYRTVFFLDHEPLQIQGESFFTTVLKKGQTECIDFDLYTEELENRTFYGISVPCNSMDYPDDVVMMYKTNSIFLY